MFQPSEAKSCPACGLKLQRLEDLPASKVVGGELEPELPPDEEVLPWTYTGRGRGALIALALLGIAAFMMPWAHEIMPERRTLSGPEMARRLGWMWAPLVSWMVMIPLVLSRRSVFRMRGARVAVPFLAAMSLLTAVVRAAFPPERSRVDPLVLEWGYGLYATAVIGALALVVGLRFGGPIDKLESRTKTRPKNETLH